MTDAPTFDQLRQKLLDAVCDRSPANIGATRATRMVDDVWPTIESLLFTGWTVNDVRETWQQRSERMEKRAHKAEALAEVLSDLDRCEHGRHEGDVCTFPHGGCGGPSKGNELLRANGHPHHGLAQREARRIGTSMSGRPIVLPERGHTHDPEAWRQ